jgi:hypothetical protein
MTEKKPRAPSGAETAMAANARSRNVQGKAEDRGRRQRHEQHLGMMDAGAEDVANSAAEQAGGPKKPA